MTDRAATRAALWIGSWGKYHALLLLCGLLAGCKPSANSWNVPEDAGARAEALARVEQEITAEPTNGNLYIQKLCLLLAESEIDWRARELWANLYKIKGGPAILSGLCKHPNGLVRRNAADLAGEMKMREALPDLRRRAEDRNADVRRAALRALRHMRDLESFRLYALLLKDPDWTVRAEAARAMGMFSTPDAVRRLSYMFKEDETWVHKYAAESIINVAQPENKEMLTELFQESRYAEARAVCGIALAKLNDPQGIQFTDRLIRQREQPFRLLAAQCLAHANPQRALALFKELLEAGESDEEVRVFMTTHVEKWVAAPVHP